MSTHVPYPQRPEYVYILQLGQLFKIGTSVNPELRIKSMTLPQRPEIVGIFPCVNGYHTEKALHERFKKEREFGEWFALSKARQAELLFWCGVLSKEAPLAKVYQIRRKG